MESEVSCIGQNQIASGAQTLDGNNREQFAPNLGELGSIAIAGNKVYTIERPKGEQRWQIRSSTLDGLTPPQTLVTLQSRPMGLAVDTTGGKLYWTDVDGKIQRANFSGGNIQNVVTGLRVPGDIALGIPTSTNPAAPENTSLVTDQLPAETRLLANYPNPFNPETWIPYQLATDTDVQILIYDARGSIIRRLVLGYQLAGTIGVNLREEECFECVKKVLRSRNTSDIM